MSSEKNSKRSQSDDGESGHMGFRASKEVVDRVDAYAKNLGQAISTIQQQAFGLAQELQITRSKALASLVHLGLALAEVDNELLSAICRRAARNKTTTGQELNELLGLALETMGEPMPAEAPVAGELCTRKAAG